MKHYLIIVWILFFPWVVYAQGETAITLAKVDVNSQDLESVKRGGRFFAANCMSCHTMVYLRYDKLAQEIGVSYDKMPVNITNWPNGITPPDLSLEADARGVDWIYTYLHSFYQDPSRPTGVNNLLVPNTAMPGIIIPFQGIQTKIEGQPPIALYHTLEWFDLLILKKPGSMTPEQFDATIKDLVNFLSYAAHPYEAKQHWLGWWVLGFLVILLILAYYLKKEYWKDIHQHD